MRRVLTQICLRNSNLFATTVRPCRHLSNRRKFRIMREDDEDFVSWQQGHRELFKKQSSAMALETFDSDQYENLKLALSEEDEEKEKDKKMEILKAAIQLYKERNPRLKRDHPQFINWCVKRMYEYDLIDTIELFEELFECFPPHQYKTIGWVNTLFPKPQPGLFVARDLIQIGMERRMKPTLQLYKNIVKSFGENHEVVKLARDWAWWIHVFEKRNPYPLPDGSYNYEQLAHDHRAMAAYVADRALDQRCKMGEVRGMDGSVLGVNVVSRTMGELSILQIPDDTMRVTGPHSIWVGRVQRWYWVLRREERGDEFEGAPLSMFVTHLKEGKEGMQIWLEDCRKAHIGIANSNILISEPDETLYIDPEEHFKERVALFSDGIDDVHIENSVLPSLLKKDGKHTLPKVVKGEDIKFIRDKDREDKDDEW